VRENRVDILRAHDENGVMVAAMMTTMMGNHNHLMVERHQRLDSRHAGSKKYCNCD
jgi:hypothetical protein